MPRLRLRPETKRNAATAAASREGVRRALGRVDVERLVRRQVGVMLDELDAAGFRRAALIAWVGEEVNARVDSVCEGSDAILVRRCGDRIGDVAEAVTQHALSEILPS